MGPKPAEGETWAAYGERRNDGFPANGGASIVARVSIRSYLGLGMALLAFLAFVARAAKARFVGPNPTYKPPSPLDGRTR
jgi:hypothetical protein